MYRIYFFFEEATSHTKFIKVFPQFFFLSTFNPVSFILPTSVVNINDMISRYNKVQTFRPFWNNFVDGIGRYAFDATLWIRYQVTFDDFYFRKSVRRMRKLQCWKRRKLVYCVKYFILKYEVSTAKTRLIFNLEFLYLIENWSTLIFFFYRFLHVNIIYFYIFK